MPEREEAARAAEVRERDRHRRTARRRQTSDGIVMLATLHMVCLALCCFALGLCLQCNLAELGGDGVVINRARAGHRLHACGESAGRGRGWTSLKP